jgi:glucosamine--fructose-6-phosphate aminotransferase (isomerizing)
MQLSVATRMCSIAAYVGSREATPILVGMLRRLEYRGFGMVELAVKDGGPATLARCRGGAADLEERIHEAPVMGNVGLGHIRCARPCALDRIACGAPAAERAAEQAAEQAVLADPRDEVTHLLKAGPISLVYDGIVENHVTLRRRLAGAGHKFASGTDTELLGQLIRESLAASARDLRQAVWMTLQQVEGTYATAVMSDVHGERVVVARNGAPLAVGLGWGEVFVASDESAIHELISDVIVPDDGEVLDLTLAGALRSQPPQWTPTVAIAPDRPRGG